MKMPTALFDATWLRLPGYEIEAMNPSLAGRADELRRALEIGVCVYPDAKRLNFYDVELPTAWAYIHVREYDKTVQLIAFARS